MRRSQCVTCEHYGAVGAGNVDEVRSALELDLGRRQRSEMDKHATWVVSMGGQRAVWTGGKSLLMLQVVCVCMV